MADPKRGLYPKFSVYRSPAQRGDRVRPEHRAYVILPEKDGPSLAALRAYAWHDDVKSTKLGGELQKWIERIEEGGIPPVEEGEADVSDGAGQVAEASGSA